MFELDAPAVHLSVCGRSDKGRVRRDNQDDFLVADLDTAPDRLILRPEGDGSGGGVRADFKVSERGVLLLVADGMGGGAGAVASRLATTWIHDTFVAAWGAERVRTSDRFVTLLSSAIRHASGRIHEQASADPALHGMGTTATAVGLIDRHFFLAHVGDSRAYLYRAGMVTQLTKDQSVVQAMIDAGAMTAQQAEESDQGSVILQALGASPQVSVELTWLEARRGDVVLLCSDGLYRLVPRAEIGHVLADTMDLAGACNRLVDLADQRGGPDNITAVLARVDGDGLEFADGHAVERRPLVISDL